MRVLLRRLLFFRAFQPRIHCFHVLFLKRNTRMMDSYIFSGICRCCASQGPPKDLTTKYHWMDHEEVYSDMLRECFNITLLLSTPQDGGICEICVTQLRNAFNFKKQVLFTEKKFKSKIKEKARSKHKGGAAPSFTNDVKVKEELIDDLDDIFVELKEETDEDDDNLMDDDTLMDEDDRDDKSLARIAIEQLQLKQLRNVAVKKTDKKKRSAGKEKTNLIARPVKITIKNYKTQKQMSLSRALRAKEQKKALPPRRSLPVKYIGLTRSRYSELYKHMHNFNTLVANCNATPFSTKNLVGYVCAYCPETYPDIPALRAHNQETHAKSDSYRKTKSHSNDICAKFDITNLSCALCYQDFDYIANLRQHLIDVHGKKYYTDIHDYIMEFKFTEQPLIKCVYCESSFETFKMIQQHMNRHYRNYLCDQCDGAFINMLKLKVHQETHKTGSFKCTLCEKTFSSEQKRKNHERITHRQKSKINAKCPQCEEVFYTYLSRNHHMLTAHNTKAAEYKCNICDQTFLVKYRLTRHIKKDHLMERTHICPECGHAFFQKRCLDEHLIKHRGDRIHKCTVCHKAYARRKTLTEHMRIHNDDRRFKCGVCGLTFVQKCSMKSHMLSNHGITLAEFENAQQELDNKYASPEKQA